MPERLKGADCKSAGYGLRWFESGSTHSLVVEKLESLVYLSIYQSRFLERWQSGSMHQF